MRRRKRPNNFGINAKSPIINDEDLNILTSARVVGSVRLAALPSEDERLFSVTIEAQRVKRAKVLEKELSLDVVTMRGGIPKMMY